MADIDICNRQHFVIEFLNAEHTIKKSQFVSQHPTWKLLLVNWVWNRIIYKDIVDLFIDQYDCESQN
jgi:hypothetical protein